MYMNGCSHLKKNKENKNRYHVMVFLAAILHKVMCLKNTVTQRILREQWLPSLVTNSADKLCNVLSITASNQRRHLSCNRMEFKSSHRNLVIIKVPTVGRLLLSNPQPLPDLPLQINIDRCIIWVISKSYIMKWGVSWKIF